MKVLGSPAVLAAVALAFAAALHPAVRAGAWLPAAPVVTAALALLLGVALVARAADRPRERALALGVLLVLLALAYDGAFGRRGSLTLAVGQAERIFEEDGPGGRSLGFRPLGFTVGLDRVTPEGSAVLSIETPSGVRTEEAGPGRAAANEGFRFGDPRARFTGEAAALTVVVGSGAETRALEVAPDRPARLDDLEIALERYFPDFALDDKQQPFTRSSEPKNPAALLRLRRGDKAFRAFVIRSMPGIHQVAELGRSFSLAAVEPARRVRLRVTREPAAVLSALGVVVAAAGLAMGLKRP